MIAHAYAPQFIDLNTPQGPVEALAFVMDPTAEHYAPELGLEESARLIATGEGLFGKSLDYLDNLAEHFALLGIVDERFSRLYERARQIAARD
jgi:cation transport protein ChaC